jgi:hypothetical protein
MRQTFAAACSPLLVAILFGGWNTPQQSATSDNLVDDHDDSALSLLQAPLSTIDAIDDILSDGQTADRLSLIQKSAKVQKKVIDDSKAQAKVATMTAPPFAHFSLAVKARHSGTPLPPSMPIGVVFTACLSACVVYLILWGEFYTSSADGGESYKSPHQTPPREAIPQHIAVLYVLLALVAPLCQIGLFDIGSNFVEGLVVGLILCLYFLIKRTFGNTRQQLWLSDDNLALRIPSFTWILLGGAALVIYYGVAASGCLGPTWNLAVVQCSWNVFQMVSLGAAGHCWFGCRKANVRYGWIPLLLQLLVTPFITADRMPFVIQPAGCPSWLNYTITPIALLWSVIALFLPNMYVAYDPIGNDLSSPGFDAVVRFRYELLPLVCAMLSCFYLMDLAVDENLTPLTKILYHVAWSYLRPAYVFLFGVYWVKRFSCLQVLQAFIYGTGFSYFLFFASLSMTKEDAKSGWESVCLPKGGATPARSELQIQFHQVEAEVFYISTTLFVVSGLFSGAWNEIYMFGVLPFSVVVAILFIVTVVMCELAQWGILTVGDDGGFKWTFSEWSCYLVVVFAATYLLLFAPKRSFIRLGVQ